jgi:hypothetical protein
MYFQRDFADGVITTFNIVDVLSIGKRFSISIWKVGGTIRVLKVTA